VVDRAAALFGVRRFISLFLGAIDFTFGIGGVYRKQKSRRTVRIDQQQVSRVSVSRCRTPRSMLSGSPSTLRTLLWLVRASTGSLAGRGRNLWSSLIRLMWGVAAPGRLTFRERRLKKTNP
jgi:hypothetical protein